MVPGSHPGFAHNGGLSLSWFSCSEEAPHGLLKAAIAAEYNSFFFFFGFDILYIKFSIYLDMYIL